MASRNTIKILNTIVQVFKLIRFHNWIKNIVIFFPVFFAGKALEIFNDYKLFQLIELYIAFCITSSIIYVINDLVDAKKDRLHPVKCNRPIANRFFSKLEAQLIIAILLVIDLFVLLSLGDTIWYVIIYFVLNIAYSLKLKNIAIVDVTCISLGFILRILAGGMASDVVVSQWMIIIAFLLSISIAFAKRRDDLVIKKDGELLRDSQLGYSVAFDRYRKEY